MDNKKFSAVAAQKTNPKWDYLIKREADLYLRNGDIRSDFIRDYNRILHCRAYRRLKHKTQVFFATENDHVCTRIEHVQHVCSISYTISTFLGLNSELTSAISLGHDLGHAPFGHDGEETISKILEKEMSDYFWHEKNSLFFVDKIETLPDPNWDERNLNLTYAVRDGIISHCGEINNQYLKPRSEYIDLHNFTQPNQYNPYTWEGCVVKIADKISYIGRDIEDAISLKILNISQLKDFREKICTILRKDVSIKSFNNTVLVHDFIIDLCRNSNPDKGFFFSNEDAQLIDELSKFSIENIYNNPRLKTYKQYTELILTTIFNTLRQIWSSDLKVVLSNLDRMPYALLRGSFKSWIEKYSIQNNKKYKINQVYDIKDSNVFASSIIHFISGMTDQFAIKVFEEINKF